MWRVGPQNKGNSPSILLPGGNQLDYEDLRRKFSSFQYNMRGANGCKVEFSSWGNWWRSYSFKTWMMGWMWKFSRNKHNSVNQIHMWELNFQIWTSFAHSRGGQKWLIRWWLPSLTMSLHLSTNCETYSIWGVASTLISTTHVSTRVRAHINTHKLKRLEPMLIMMMRLNVSSH
jgi:hypothetical protein